MGYKADKEKRKIRDHNKEYLGLTEFEIILHEAIISMDNEKYPADLKRIVRKQCEERGWYLSIEAEGIAEWLKSKLREKHTPTAQLDMNYNANINVAKLKDAFNPKLEIEHIDKSIAVLQDKIKELESMKARVR